jgi:hypothetical protein
MKPRRSFVVSSVPIQNPLSVFRDWVSAVEEWKLTTIVLPNDIEMYWYPVSRQVTDWLCRPDQSTVEIYKSPSMSSFYNCPPRNSRKASNAWYVRAPHTKEWVTVSSVLCICCYDLHVSLWTINFKIILGDSWRALDAVAGSEVILKKYYSVIAPLTNNRAGVLSMWLPDT